MTATLVLATVAVLTGTGVAVVAVDSGTVTASLPLGGQGLAVMAAPDGSLLVPMAASDDTVRWKPGEPPERIPGRLFPLFHDEADRMVVALPGQVAVLSYPERLELRRTQLPVREVWRAALTGDGQFLVLLAGPEGRDLLMLDLPGSQVLGRMTVAPGCRALTMEPQGTWLALGCADGGVHIVRGGVLGARPLQVAGAVTALAASPDGRFLAVGSRQDDGSGTVLVLRISEREGTPRQVARQGLAGGVTAVAVAGDQVVVATEHGLSVFARRRLRVQAVVEVPGARELAVMPASGKSLVPAWSDGRPDDPPASRQRLDTPPG